MMRLACPSLTFLSARGATSRSDRGDDKTGSTKWPEFDEAVNDTTPFEYLGFLGSKPGDFVVGGVRCYLTKSCGRFADGKVENFKYALKRFPQIKNVMLLGDNGQGDYDAWKKIITASEFQNITFQAFIQQTLKSTCGGDGKCELLPQNETYGFNRSDTPCGDAGAQNKVKFVRGWRCALNELQKDKFYNSSEVIQIQEK